MTCKSTCEFSEWYAPLSPPSYPVVSQLQTDLYEGVRADTELLNVTFPKFSEGKHMAVHILCQHFGNHQRVAHLSLHLKHTQGK